MDYILIYTLYVVILSILMGISTWKLFQKMGHSPILAFVPFYNYYIIQKETKHLTWWVIFAYFPIVGTIMMSVFHLFLMEKFGKTSLSQKLMTIFLPFIYMAMVNYSADTELEEESLYEEEKRESFLGSITYAVVFATLFHTFLAQPFTIPTGSMERTLLVGDFLFVNKWSYGYRMPMRPVALPFLQNTILDTGVKGDFSDDPKSYVESIKLPYFRILGSKINRNDIVVFNNPDDAAFEAIDRKTPYVKRVVAVAGDELAIKGGQLLINGKPDEKFGDAIYQSSYIAKMKADLDITNLYEKHGFIPIVVGQDNQTGEYVYYFIGISKELAQEISQYPEVESITESISEEGVRGEGIFPENKNWNKDWYGSIKIPKKGDIITLNQENLPMYKKLITEYEGNTLVFRDNQIFINEIPTNQYEVKLDYYYMIGDNRHNSLDSRFFGFVPETHIMGKPMFTWMSVEGLFADSQSSFQANGKKIRWDRMFKETNTGDPNKPSYWWVAVILLVVFFGWDYIMKLFKKKKEEE